MGADDVADLRVVGQAAVDLGQPLQQRRVVEIGAPRPDDGDVERLRFAADDRLRERGVLQ